MTEWKPSWWARTFRSTGTWVLSIDSGRLRLHEVEHPFDVDVLEVVGFLASDAEKEVHLYFRNGARVPLRGLSRKSRAEVSATFTEQFAERQWIVAATDVVTAQGGGASMWWARVQTLMAEPRWIDHDSIKHLELDRPELQAWVAADTDSRLQVICASRPNDEIVAVSYCRSTDLWGWMQQRNEEFLALEKQELAQFLRTVEKSPLTEEQSHAVICFDNRVRVIAAAGSGKTSTMVARAGYAIHRGIAQPHEILALAFNTKAAGELSERMTARLGEQGAAVTSKTFHAFGLQIIGHATGKKPRIPADLVNDQGVPRLGRVVDILRDHNPRFRRDWDLFRLVFGRHLPELEEDTEPEKVDRRTKVSGFGTLGGDTVQSQEEVMIANWLFINGVQYDYERPYAHDVASPDYSQYRPDFYFPEIDVWYEHWAIGANGQPPPHFDGYDESMQWRRNTHARFGTQLIETTSASIRDGSGFDHLKNELLRRGVVLDENPNREPVGEPPTTDRAMLELMRGFMVHAKGNRHHPDLLKQRAGTSLRSRLFVSLYTTIIPEWDRQLRDAGEVDFEDMVNLATDLVAAGRWDNPYRVVMVDEMQDTSVARASLIRAISAHPGTFLYAVGDDWQSINRFAGSDLSVMTDFDRRFGPAHTVYLDQTFRSPQSLCTVAGSFVAKNPAQIEKLVRSYAPDSGDTLTALSVQSSNDYNTVLSSHLANLDETVSERASVLLLGRYNRSKEDISSILDKKFRNLTVEFATVHSSKGSEADYVVVLGVEARAFPSTMKDDPILQLAMSTPDPYPYAEERRLFYVALTRARRSVLLLTQVGKESPFLVELIRDGRLTVRSARGTDITPTICPMCSKRTMRKRNGQYGAFLGCSGYPLCKGTSSLAN